MGKATDVMWEEIIHDKKLSYSSKELVRQNEEISKRHFAQQKLAPMDGLVELLGKLKKNKISMAVASSSGQEIIDVILKSNGLDKYFKYMVSSELVGGSKPEPDIFLHTAKLLEFKLKIACPEGFEPQQSFVDETRDFIEITHDVSAACTNSDLIVTDVWASMGQEEEQKIREQAFSAYQVTAEVMGLANKDALFMHCLPAHRGEEVSADVIDGEQSVVWDEAENRLHAQKALLEFLLVN